MFTFYAERVVTHTQIYCIYRRPTAGFAQLYLLRLVIAFLPSEVEIVDLYMASDTLLMYQTVMMLEIRDTVTETGCINEATVAAIPTDTTTEGRPTVADGSKTDIKLDEHINDKQQIMEHMTPPNSVRAWELRRTFDAESRATTTSMSRNRVTRNEEPAFGCGFAITASSKECGWRLPHQQLLSKLTGCRSD
mmetsp:Transcript_10960/g.33625  ORF Transcript_10960/g.33625 Transcript_10960/m.33625 type:complete len:192 (-) Transcript_10960:52-627(-)